MSEGDSDKRISYMPTDGLCYDPEDPAYWDEAGLKKETTRVFEVCHGCRLCFKYCDSFPALFSAIDERHDGDVRRVTARETQEVMDACFQCKLCEVQCPYTPRDGHEFQLDFPKLVHRYRAIRRREHGGTLRDKMLGDPDRAAQMARASLGLLNRLNRAKAHRWLMERVMGVHRDKLLPDFAQRTFERWAKRTGRISSAAGGEVVLFQTCFVQHNEPQIGRDAIEVFEHNGVDARCAAGFSCCGMPAWDSGDLGALQKKARHNLELLRPFVDAGAKIAVINPTCSMMLRREYPKLVEQDLRPLSERVSEAVRDCGELVWELREQGRFKTDFKSSPQGKVAYHVPCHLRAQSIGFRGRDLLKRLPGVDKVSTVMACCGHDGTYAMTEEGFEPSQRIGEDAFSGMQKPDAAVWSTDCPLAAIQFAQHAGKKPLHPMTMLARAYRGDRFDGPAEPGGSDLASGGDDS